MKLNFTLFLLLSSLITACSPSKFSQTNFKASVEADLKKINARVTSGGYNGSPENHQWEITFIAEEAKAREVFNKHLNRVRSALILDGHKTTDGRAGGGSDISYYAHFYGSNSLVTFHFIRHEKDKCSIIHLIHE